MQLIRALIDAWRAACAGLPAEPVSSARGDGLSLSVGVTTRDRVYLQIGHAGYFLNREASLWLSDQLRTRAMQSAFTEAGMEPVELRS